jgi:hypothetical protein
LEFLSSGVVVAQDSEALVVVVERVARGLRAKPTTWPVAAELALGRG